VGVIRPAAPADAQAILELRLANRSRLAPFEPDAPADPESRYRLDGVERWVAAGDGRYVIVDAGTLAGTVGLFDIEGPPIASAILGYWVDAAREGRGLATRAVAEVLAVAFGELGLHRVEAGTRVDNVGSQRVLQRNGFTCVGLLRRHLLIQGEWVDHLLWERLADD
jgi:[ribosomal protein S5]-alanine N-acetyltransferase